jgi:AraC family ethanolamine operon transcriptional activator
LKSSIGVKTPKFSTRTTGRVKHLRQARGFVKANAHRAFELEELCRSIGMSHRGVELLFRESLDISPNAFIRNQRLHGVRRVLLNSTPRAGVVKESAMEWGFSHMGHFSQTYRRLFDERPNETARR